MLILILKTMPKFLRALILSLSLLPTLAFGATITIDPVPPYANQLNWSYANVTSPGTTHVRFTNQTKNITYNGSTPIGTTQTNGSLRIGLSGSVTNGERWNAALIDQNGTSLSTVSFIIGNTQSVTPTLSAYTQIQGESYSAMQGIQNNGTTISDLDTTDWVLYKNVDFGTTGAKGFTAHMSVTTQFKGGIIEVYLDSTTGTPISRLMTVDTTSWTNFTDQSAITTPSPTPTGVHDVYLVFVGTEVAALDFFAFSTTVPSPLNPVPLGGGGTGGVCPYTASPMPATEGTIDAEGKYHYPPNTSIATPAREFPTTGPKSFKPTMRCLVIDLDNIIAAYGSQNRPWPDGSGNATAKQIWADVVAAGAPVVATYSGDNFRWRLPDYGCISVKFTTGGKLAAMSFISEMDPIAPLAQYFFNISRNPGDFDYTNLMSGMGGGSGTIAANWYAIGDPQGGADTPGGFTAYSRHVARLETNTTYYINIRNEAVSKVPDVLRGVDICSDYMGNFYPASGCGGVFQLHYVEEYRDAFGNIVAGGPVLPPSPNSCPNTSTGGAPTAKITVSGGLKSVTVKAGETTTKTWTSTGGAIYDATWSATGATCAYKGLTNQHWNGLDGKNKAGDTESYVETADAVGCTFVVTYKVTNSAGQTASDSISVTISSGDLCAAQGLNNTVQALDWGGGYLKDFPMVVGQSYSFVLNVSAGDAGRLSTVYGGTQKVMTISKNRCDFSQTFVGSRCLTSGADPSISFSTISGRLACLVAPGLYYVNVRNAVLESTAAGEFPIFPIRDSCTGACHFSITY